MTRRIPSGKNNGGRKRERGEGQWRVRVLRSLAQTIPNRARTESPAPSSQICAIRAPPSRSISMAHAANPLPAAAQIVCRATRQPHRGVRPRWSQSLAPSQARHVASVTDASLQSATPASSAAAVTTRCTASAACSNTPRRCLLMILMKQQTRPLSLVTGNLTHKRSRAHAFASPMRGHSDQMQISPASARRATLLRPDHLSPCHFLATATNDSLQPSAATLDGRCPAGYSCLVHDRTIHMYPISP